MPGIAQLQPNQTFARDFRVIRPIAEGGMGAVYLVEQLSTGRERALKIMHPDLAKDAESRERFSQEAKAGARIASEHVVEVLAAGVDDATGIPWLAMELLHGEELSALVQRRKRLPPAEVLEIFRQLCHGLGEAHKAGLVHRDIKPQNIFIASSRRQNVAFTVKILDLGVAKLVQENQEQEAATRAVGTPRWMAPEQTESNALIRPCTDVWPLGLLAYELLTGSLYWKSAQAKVLSPQAVMRELIVDPLVPASVRAAESGCEAFLPPGFDSWFARCVVREQERRYPDALAALEALVPVLEGAPGVDSTKPARPRDLATVDQVENAPTVYPVAQAAQAAAEAPALPVQAPTHPYGAPPPPAAAPAATLPPAAPLTIAPSAGRPWAAYIAAVSGVLATGVSVYLIQRQGQRGSVDASAITDGGAPMVAGAPRVNADSGAPHPALAEFTLHLESEPSGAEVREEEQKVGVTPMDITVTQESVAHGPRRFTLEKEGYVPFEVAQGRSDVARVPETVKLDLLPHDRVAKGLGKVRRGLSEAPAPSPDNDERRER